MKNVKLNPYIHVFDAVRDEKLEIIFDSKDWVEVKEADWGRLKESRTRQGDIVLPTFVEESMGMGEIKGISDVKEEVSSDEEWFGTDEVVEEEE